MSRTKNILKINEAKLRELSSGVNNPTTRAAATLAHLLELPCFPLLTPDLQAVAKMLATKIRKSEQDLQALVSQNISAFVDQIPVFTKQLEKSINGLEQIGSKWLINDYGPTARYMLENIPALANSLEAVVTMYLYSANKTIDVDFSPVGFLPNLFIQFAPLELIQNDDMLNYHAKTCYEIYITRLPADELHEFLTSEVKGARVMAKNKVIQDLSA